MIRQTEPGLVALYDIRPGNGAGPFLQPRSPHGAYISIELWPFVRKNICLTEREAALCDFFSLQRSDAVGWAT